MKQLIIVILLALGSSLCTGCSIEKPNKTAVHTDTAANVLSVISSLKLPSQLTLFGEAIPLDLPDVRERAEREFYLLLQQPGQIILNRKRSGRYFPLFSAVLSEFNIPDDLKYLAMAESALYMSKSPKDAVGIWQFIEGTAKRYGLMVDEYVDERRHVEKSTRAAAEFLSDAYKKFGSWMLAASAYYMGVEGVRFNVQLQGSTSYFDLHFNEETSRYILRIAILKQILENAELYGLKLDAQDIYKPDSQRRVKVYHPIENLAAWAQQNGTTYKYVKLLNPWILKTSLPKPKNGFWEITLP